MLGDLLLLAGAIGAGVNALGRLLGDRASESDLRGLEERSDKLRGELHEVKTIEERIALLEKLAQDGALDPEVRAFSVEAVSQRCGNDWCTRDRDYDAELTALFNALRKKIRYVRDTLGVDTFTNPKRTLQLGGGDCDDMAIVMSATAMTLGYQTAFRVVRTHGAEDWNHVYTLVGIPPEGDAVRWVAFDLSVNKPAGWEIPKRDVAEARDFEVRPRSR